MRLFGFEIKRAPAQDTRNTTNDDVAAVMQPLGDIVCDFKERTGMSWLHILSTLQEISVRMFIQARGISATRSLYTSIVDACDAEGGVPTRSIMNYGKPPVSADQLSILNEMLWKFATVATDKGVPVELLAQGFSATAVKIAKVIVPDGFLIRALLAESLKRLESREFGA